MGVIKVSKNIYGRRCTLVYDNTRLVGVAVGKYYITESTVSTTRYPKYVLETFKLAKRKYRQLEDTQLLRELAKELEIDMVLRRRRESCSVV